MNVGRTYNKNDIRVTGLHLGGRRGILVSNKVLCIYDSNDSV